MEIKESFVIHTEWIEDLPEEYKSIFLMHIYIYGSRGIEPQLSGLEQTLWLKIQRRIDEDQDKWEESKQRRSVAGKRGANKRWNNTQAPEEPEEEPKPRRKFQKPTTEEISAYCEERHNGIDAQRFYDYYEANGWKVGKNPMKNWKAAVRNWEQRQKQPYGSAGRSLPEERLTL